MNGWRLFRHAVLILVDNLGPAFRISVVPVLGAQALMFVPLTLYFDTNDTDSFMDDPGLFAVWGLMSIIVSLFAYSWVAVGYHRFVLLQEQPGRFFPNWHQATIISYILAGLRMIPLLVLVVLVVGVPVALLSELPRVSTDDLNPAGLIFDLVITFVILRISLILPAAALGNRMKVWESFQLTKPVSGAIFVASVFSALLSWIPMIMSLTPLSPIFGGLVYQLLATWMLFMVSISLATTLYGVLVEDRTLR